MDNNNNKEIKLTALQRAKKKYYEKIKNDPIYLAKRANPEFKAQLRANCKKYYNKIKDDPEFKQKVSIQKKEKYKKMNEKKIEELFQINL
jgi:hypothetical protein